MKARPKIALVVSHPIQHFCPQYASFAKHPDIDFKVFFASALGFKPYHDPNFKQTIAWNNLQLDQFEHEFLNGEDVLQVDKNLDAPGLDKALSRFRPDIIIIYGYFQRYQRRAFSWAKRNKVKVAYIADTEMRQTRSGWKERLKYLYLRYFFSGVNYALTVGDANEEYYKHVGLKGKQLIRMHFPIDVNLYKKSYEKRLELRIQTREHYKINNGEFVACVVGKLVPWKNQSDIIAAMHLLEEQGVVMHLFIVGSGEMMNEWQQQAKSLKKSKVHFTGFKTAEELPAFYAASDVYIHPAAVEPHSLAVSEAIYMSCPVIISDRCGSYGPTDDVQENRNGFVYPFGDIAILADRIKRMIADPQRRRQFSRYSHSLAQEFQSRAHRQVVHSLIGEYVRS